jgi:hypothetical protein
MKKSLLLIIVTVFFYQLAFCQQNFHSFKVAAGISLYNTKTVSLSYEKIKEGGLGYGFIMQGIYYNGTDNHKYNFSHTDCFLTGGGYLTLKTLRTTNFNNYVYLGAQVGSNNDSILWYPFGGLNQRYFVSNRVLIELSEEAAYYFNQSINQKFQPKIKLGLDYLF